MALPSFGTTAPKMHDHSPHSQVQHSDKVVLQNLLCHSMETQHTGAGHSNLTMSTPVLHAVLSCASVNARASAKGSPRASHTNSLQPAGTFAQKKNPHNASADLVTLNDDDALQCQLSRNEDRGVQPAK